MLVDAGKSGSRMECVSKPHDNILSFLDRISLATYFHTCLVSNMLQPLPKEAHWNSYFSAQFPQVHRWKLPQFVSVKNPTCTSSFLNSTIFLRHPHVCRSPSLLENPLNRPCLVHLQNPLVWHTCLALRGFKNFEFFRIFGGCSYRISRIPWEFTGDFWGFTGDFYICLAQKMRWICWTGSIG